MALIAYPPALPAPAVATTEADERRLLSPKGGYFESRAVERDRRTTQTLTFPPFTADQAAAFWSWWKGTLVFGGAWFRSAWPLPAGFATAVRQFVGVPQSQRNDALEQITAVVTVRGRGLDPDDYVPLFGTGQFFVPSAMGGNGLALSNSNLTATHNGSSHDSFRAAYLSDRNDGESPVISDRRYFEMVVSGTSAVGVGVGFGLDSGIAGGVVNPYGSAGFYLGSGINHGVNPGVITNGTEGDNGTYSFFNLGFTIGVAVDGASGHCFFSVDGTWISDPIADESPAFTLPSESVAPFVTMYSDTSGGSIAVTAQLGADLTYAPPAGFRPWNQTFP